MKIRDARTSFSQHCRSERTLSPHTVRAYDLDLSRFAAFLTPAERISEVNRDHVRGYLTHLTDTRKLAPASLRRHVVTLRLFFAWLTDEGHVKASPFQTLRVRISIPPRLPRALSRSETRQLLDAAARSARHLIAVPPQRRSLRRRPSASPIGALTHLLALELLLATGIRVGELIRLRPADLDLAEGVLRVIGKGNRQRVVFLPGTRVRRLLDSYLARRAALQPRAESLFVADDLRPITAPGVRAFLKEIAKSAGLSRRVTPHLLRHTAATLLLEAGVDIRFVQRLLGHASIMTTQLYTHVSDKALQTAISRARVTDLLARR